MSEYKLTVGVEVHAELKTKSKMFCGCANDPHASEPNTHVCPVCMAHPGTLPTVNERAVELMMQIGAAVGGELSDYSEFDRKNYFYPDIPKAYQISQYQFPFVVGGEVAGVELTRIHLEEDTARSQHEGGHSLVDYNRAGVPLMELVTEPVIHSAEAAGKFARELQLLLRTLGASDANMERGEMRVEANISISKTDELGTKVEVKNLNSFRSVESAIAYEVERQAALLEAGESVIQETRGWDEQKQKTFSQRVKESADDYRYFPDPDIPKVVRSEITKWQLETISAALPELPVQKRERYTALGVTEEQTETIIGDLARDQFFSAAVATTSDPKTVKILANYFTSDILGGLEGETTYQLSDGTPAHFTALGEMVTAGDINSRVAKDLLFEVVFENKEPRALAEERGLLQQSSEDDLLPIVDVIIAENESVVAEYKAGKESALQFFVGQGMKATKGSANPGTLIKLLKQRLDG